MAKKCKKKCSVSLIIMGMQMKTTMRYHLIPVRMAITQKTKVLGGCGVKEILVHYSSEGKL